MRGVAAVVLEGVQRWYLRGVAGVVLEGGWLRCYLRGGWLRCYLRGGGCGGGAILSHHHLCLLLIPGIPPSLISSLYPPSPLL